MLPLQQNLSKNFLSPAWARGFFLAINSRLLRNLYYNDMLRSVHPGVDSLCHARLVIALILLNSQKQT